MSSKKDKIKDLKDFPLRISRILVKHFFITLICLLVLGLILSGILFYKYYLQKIDSEFQPQILGINSKLLNDILEEWQKREEIFKSVNPEQNLDLFRF